MEHIDTASQARREKSSRTRRSMDAHHTSPGRSSPEFTLLAQEVLRLLHGPVGAFVSGRMRDAYGDRWVDYALGALHATPGLARTRRSDLETDLSAMLTVAGKFWQVAFSKGSARFTRTYLEEVREFRNLLAHGGTLTLSDLLRLVDTVHRLLRAIGHPDCSLSGRLRADLLIQTFAALQPAFASSPSVRALVASLE